MKRLVQAYLVEAKWFNKNYTPTVDEYMSIALLSCGYPLLTITAFVGVGDIATTEAFDWASKDPKILRAASMICRLMDDIVSHEDINEECLRPSNVLMPLFIRVINLARVIDYFYTDGDEYTHVGELMKSSIKSMLIDYVKIL
uniref:Terpene synthase metal-binding domain-containing protein n=2 Tax=Manihot esculenta TaxID=3983 RepID=A0A2C9U9Z6_MANES